MTVINAVRQIKEVFGQVTPIVSETDETALRMSVSQRLLSRNEMIDIPMNTKPAMGLDSLSSSVSSNSQQPMQQNFQQQPQNFQQPAQNNFQQPQSYQQPMQNNNYQQQQSYQQPAQNNYQQQPQSYQQTAQNNFQQPQSYQQPAQNNYQQQPQQNYRQPAAGQSGGGVVIKKGQKTSLSKLNPNLKSIRVGLGWDVGMNSNYDLDCEVFMLGANERVLGDNWFVFYGQLASPDGSVIHHGDSTTGEGAGDDEIIDIDLARLNPQVAKLVFVVTINEAKEHGYNFGQVCNAYIRIIDNSNGKELVKFSLSEYYKEVISMVVGEVYLKGGEWRFNPVGMGTGEDLEELCVKYGVNIAG